VINMSTSKSLTSAAHSNVPGELRSLDPLRIS